MFDNIMFIVLNIMIPLIYILILIGRKGTRPTASDLAWKVYITGFFIIGLALIDIINLGGVKIDFDKNLITLRIVIAFGSIYTSSKLIKNTYDNNKFPI